MTYPSFAAGEVLGAADMNAVGLWLVKTQTVGTGVSSVTVTGAFSANYDAYKILWTNGQASNSTAINMQLGSSTTGYYSGSIYSIYAGGTGSTRDNNVFGFFNFIGACAVDTGTSLSLDVINPFLARPTLVGGPFMVTDVAGATGGVHKVSASYTSFTLTPGAGTFTGGTIRVYGYRN